MRQYENLTLRLSHPLKKKLVAYSEETGQSQNAIVLQALAEFFSKIDMTNKGMEMAMQLMVNNPDLFNSLIHSEKNDEN